jgi:predicted DNA-binding transcriptional regulator YafY
LCHGQRCHTPVHLADAAPAQPNQKAASLAAELGISVRSLHRYMGMLEEMGIPVYAERGPYGGFSLVRGYKMPPLIFTTEEAVAVYLGASLVIELGQRRLVAERARAVARLYSENHFL